MCHFLTVLSRKDCYFRPTMCGNPSKTSRETRNLLNSDNSRSATRISNILILLGETGGTGEQERVFLSVLHGNNC